MRDVNSNCWDAILRMFLTAALIVLVAVCADNAEAQEDTQGWSQQERLKWYSLSQGSRLLPLTWFKAFERPGSRELLLSKKNIERHRYIPLEATDWNPHGLPLGFVVDEDTNANLKTTYFAEIHEPKWVGMTCAACHTAEIQFGQHKLRIEGAPAKADFQGFMEELVQSVRETVANTDDRFSRFSKRVLSNPDVDQIATLNDNLTNYFRWLDAVETQNTSAGKTDKFIRYGYGRLDAVGHILNKVEMLAASEKRRSIPANAPVRYPHIWGVHRHRHIQWNGMATNGLQLPLNADGSTKTVDFGALSRNVGEVIGVFADVAVGNDSLGYHASARIENLIELEGLLMRLQPPKWPNIFPVLDPAKVQSGREIYNGKGQCSTCHINVPREDLLKQIDVRKSSDERMVSLSKVQTDIWMTCNAVNFRAHTGAFTGRNESIVFGDPVVPPSSGSELNRIPGARLLRHLIIGVIVRDQTEEILGGIKKKGIPKSLFGETDGARLAKSPDVFVPTLEVWDADRKRAAQKCASSRSSLLKYKARPLHGIWAASPYLHNGSVPTLADLLLPSDQRPIFSDGIGKLGSASASIRSNEFNIGTRRFDPQKVGFETHPEAEGNTQTFSVTRAARGGFTPILGNSNSGHPYGWSLNKDEREALVEYLKSL